MQIQIWKARTWCLWVGSGSLGLLEGYGGRFKAAEHGGKAVDIDSTSYICAMCMQCCGTIQRPLGCVWLCWGALLSVCECVCAKPKFMEVVGMQMQRLEPRCIPSSSPLISDLLDTPGRAHIYMKIDI